MVEIKTETKIIYKYSKLSLLLLVPIIFSLISFAPMFQQKEIYFLILLILITMSLYLWVTTTATIVSSNMVEIKKIFFVTKIANIEIKGILASKKGKIKLITVNNKYLTLPAVQPKNLTTIYELLNKSN